MAGILETFDPDKHGGEFPLSADAVIRAAAELNGDMKVALAWYTTEAIAVFDGKTAQQLVDEGRGNDLLKYIQMLGAGFSG